MVPSYFVFANFHFRYLSEQFSKIECQDNLCNVPLQPGFISPTQQQGPRNQREPGNPPLLSPTKADSNLYEAYQRSVWAPTRNILNI